MSFLTPQSRRIFLIQSLACLLKAGRGLAETSNQIVSGAIRWDAWYQRTGNSIFAQNSLDPPQFHTRAPAHCTEISSTKINCIGTQRVIDEEILAAEKAKLTFWAFMWYAEDSGFRAAWHFYQQSAYRNRINWCGIVTLDLLGSLSFDKGDWIARVDEWVGYMQQENYQRVGVGGNDRGRPLIFIYWLQSDVLSYFGGKISNVAKMLDQLRLSLKSRGLSSPYVVILNGAAGASFLTQIGADAISSYISAFKSETAGPYSDLDQQTRDYWQTLANTGAQTVPIAMVGWDTRPRHEHPVPWQQEQHPDPRKYYVLPTPSELTSHIRAAVRFIETNPAACPSRVLLIYSWDECDEGGGLIPTLGDRKGSYLSAVGSVL